jgi:PAS domain S-box-containing protein
MPEPFRSRHDGYIRHHLETGERKIIGIGRQVMGRRKSGAIFSMHLSVSAFTADGQRYFTGIVHDLSDQRGVGAVREQALFEAIFNHLPDAVLVADADHKILLCSPAVARVFGYAPEELIGQKTAVLYDTPAESERIRRMETRLREQEMSEPVTVSYRRKSGEAFPAETVTSVLRDQEGQFIGLISLNRDISKQVVQDEALRKSQRMEAIGQLTGGIAHDFNNLLTIITGNHELLEMELQDAEQRDLLTRANNAALMGARLTNRLLTFARRRRLDPVVLDLNEQVLAMAELLRRTLGEAIALGTLLAPRLWSVKTDPSEVENAVLNLAINSRDAMPAGGKLVIVSPVSCAAAAVGLPLAARSRSVAIRGRYTLTVVPRLTSARMRAASRLPVDPRRVGMRPAISARLSSGRLVHLPFVSRRTQFKKPPAIPKPPNCWGIFSQGR